MRRSLILLLALALTQVAHADRGPRICADLVDCEQKCKKGNGEACLVAGTQSDRGEDAGDDGSKARGFYDKACKKKLARGCLMLARSLETVGDAAAKKKAAAAYKQAAALFDKQCKKQENAAACEDLASLYAAGQGVAKDEKKAQDYYQRYCKIRFKGACPPPSPPPGRPQQPRPSPAPR